MGSPAPLMLSISGLRGLIGASLTPPVAARYAAAFASWLKTHSRQGPCAQPRVVIGRDSRPSGQMIELAAAAGLIACGCRVTTLGIATTPAVGIMTEHLGADGGMVITASHNPIIWNGIKCLTFAGVAPPAEAAQNIIARFGQNQALYAAVETLAPLQADDSTARVHVDRVLRHIDVPAVQRRKLKVVLDSVHGAGGPSTALLLEKLGVQVIHLYAEPTGLFPHPPEPTKQNLTGLGAAVRREQADAGFAQDPDADRLALVDEQGTYIGEEYTLALSVWHLLEKRQAAAQAPGAVLAANLSTSRMIDDVAHQYGATVVRTPVGEANVAAAMRQHQAYAGGEGNGGVIFPPVGYIRDSLTGIALVCEMLARRQMPLSQVVGAIPSYAIVKDKVDAAPALMASLAQRMRQAFAAQKLDTQDGVRVDWPDRWVHVRPSNTEPIVRLIAEARDEGAAQALIAQAKHALGL